MAKKNNQQSDLQGPAGALISYTISAPVRGGSNNPRAAGANEIQEFISQEMNVPRPVNSYYSSIQR